MIKFIIGFIIGILTMIFGGVIFSQYVYTAMLVSFVLVGLLIPLLIYEKFGKKNKFVFGFAVGLLIISLQMYVKSRIGCGHHACRSTFEWAKQELGLEINE